MLFLYQAVLTHSGMSRRRGLVLRPVRIRKTWRSYHAKSLFRKTILTCSKALHSRSG